MNRVAVINVVGLTSSLIGEHTPRIRDFAQRGAKAIINPAFPAVTCTAQSNYLTGAPPATHGIVGNGWYNRELAEVQFWKQSNHLVHGPKVWEELRAQSALRAAETPRSPFRCAKLFWWYNMYSTADYSITPRPMYPADGSKHFDIYSWPYSIRDEIKRDLGEFPFPTFWGPGAGKESPAGAPDAASRWIAESAKWMEKKYQPDLNLVYLPHLDYNLQRFGPFVEEAKTTGALRKVAGQKINPAIVPDLRAIDGIVGGLIDFFQSIGVHVVLLSEYGITNVNNVVHLNRLFRAQRWVTVKEELGLELLDCGASRAFAVADHQVAHIYLNDPSLEGRVRELLAGHVETILGKDEKFAAGIDHPRAGDLIAVAKENSWFSYYYWNDDTRAPDFARTVDIHRKPGYDPVELFTNPALSQIELQARIVWKLMQKKLGFRMLMDVVPLDAALVKGSHGRRPSREADYPVFISQRSTLLGASTMESTDVYHAIQRHVVS